MEEAVFYIQSTVVVSEFDIDLWRDNVSLSWNVRAYCYTNKLTTQKTISKLTVKFKQMS